MRAIFRLSTAIIFCFCFFVLPVHAKVNNIVLERITVEDGLSQASVMALAQDKQGYIWFGTENGINIYDGYTISSLPGPDNDFHKFSVNNIYVASDGLVWVSLFDKGLYTYNPVTNEYHLISVTDENGEMLNVWKITQDIKNNDIWFITEKLAFRYSSSAGAVIQKIDFTELFTTIGTLFNVNVFNNRVLFSSRKALFVYDLESARLTQLPSVQHSEKTGQNFDVNESAKVFGVTLIADRYYVGTNDGVFSFTEQNLTAFLQAKTEKITYQLLLENVAIWKIIAFKGVAYVATTSGLYRINHDNKKAEFLLTFGEYFQTVADTNVLDLFFDYNGQLWMGSQSSGAYRWDPNTEIITTYTYDRRNPNSLSSGNVSALLPTLDNQLWVATDDGLNLVDLETNSIKRYLVNENKKNAYTQSNISDIKKDYLGRMWLSTADGIILFSETEKTILQTNFPATTLELLKVKNGWAKIASLGEYIWMISDQGIHKIHAKTGEATHLDSFPDYFNSRYASSIMASFSQDPNDVLIATTDTLWQYNQITKQLSKVYTHQGLSKEGDSYIDRWVRDSAGLIWFSYSQVGVFAIDPDNYQVQYFFDDHNSILATSVYGIQVDSADNIWVSSHGGLFRLRANDRHIRRFNRLDGLAGSEFNAGAFNQLQDGRLAYGGIAGVSLFDPITLENKNNNAHHTVSIVNVDTLSRPLNLPLFLANNQQVDLAYDDFGIHIGFSDFSYGHIENPTFKFGFVGDVSFPETQQNFVTFPRLDSGNYIFQVQVKTVLSGQYSEPALLRINVSYAPWKSPLAYSLYAIALIICSVLLYRRRQLRQKNLVAAHKEVQFRENRLRLALSASNSDVWDWQAESDVIFAKRFSNELGYQDQALAISLSKHIDFIHPEDQPEFSKNWQKFINNADPEGLFECTYRLKCYNGNWMWYRDVGKIVAFDYHGQPSRVTGSYSNVTESKAMQERAQYYGAAFEQTRDWVLIFDEAFEIGRANKSMSDVFGWEHEELSLADGIPGITQDRTEYYRKLLPIILRKGHWRGEELITTPNGKEYHVIINISVSQNIEHQKTHFICVYTDITAQKFAEDELRIMANYDHLTSLPNRTLLLDRIAHAIASSNRSKAPVALFFIDLDRFKQINDSLGHECGDLLLKEVSQRLVMSMRADDTLARIGGDEFVALFERFRSTNELAGIAQKLINVVQQPFTLKNNVVSIGASIGISLYPNDADGSEDLLRNADVAMYHAKQLGRNNYQFFTEHMNTEAKQRLEKETNLKLAFAHDEFFNVYQPVIDAYSGKAIGAELLMRWLHNDSVVSPVQFISLAEELGLIIGMTEQAISRGFEQLKLWRAVRPDFYLSVNFSARHFSDNNLIAALKSQLTKFDLPANALKIEVTENAFIYEPEKAIETMKELSAMGVLLALDDFGTGFSSLAYLKQLPLDIIKIDRSFVNGIGVEKTDEAIVEATLVLANSLNMYCIAEGVETEAQLNYLVERQCHYIQGYLYCKPISATELTERLQDNSVEIKVASRGSKSNNN